MIEKAAVQLLGLLVKVLNKYCHHSVPGLISVG